MYRGQYGRFFNGVGVDGVHPQHVSDRVVLRKDDRTVGVHLDRRRSDLAERMVTAVHSLAPEMLGDGVAIYKGEFPKNLVHGILPFLQGRLAAKEDERVGSHAVITDLARFHDGHDACAVLHEHHLRRPLGAKLLGEIPHPVPAAHAGGEITYPAFLQAVGRCKLHL